MPDGMSVFSVRTLNDSLAALEAIKAGDTSGLTTCQDVVDASPKAGAK